MHVSFIEFRVLPGREADFVAAFADCGMLTRPREIDGFVSAELVRDRQDGARFAVVGAWRTAQAYAAWQAVSQSGAPRPALARLAACLAEAPSGRLFDPA